MGAVTVRAAGIAISESNPMHNGALAMPNLTSHFDSQPDGTPWTGVNAPARNALSF